MTGHPAATPRERLREIVATLAAESMAKSDTSNSPDQNATAATTYSTNTTAEPFVFGKVKSKAKNTTNPSPASDATAPTNSSAKTTSGPFVFGTGTSTSFKPPKPPALSPAAVQVVDTRLDSRVRLLQTSLQSAIGTQLNTQLSAGLDRLTTAAQAEVRLQCNAALSSLRGQQQQAQQALLLQASAQVTAARQHLTIWLQREIEGLRNAQTAEMIRRETEHARYMRELTGEMEELAGSVGAVVRVERMAMADEVRSELRAELKQGLKAELKAELKQELEADLKAQLQAELMHELKLELKSEIESQHVQLGARLTADWSAALRDAGRSAPAEIVNGTQVETEPSLARSQADDAANLYELADIVSIDTVDELLSDESVRNDDRAANVQLEHCAAVAAKRNRKTRQGTSSRRSRLLAAVEGRTPKERLAAMVQALANESRANGARNDPPTRGVNLTHRSLTSPALGKASLLFCLLLLHRLPKEYWVPVRPRSVLEQYPADVFARFWRVGWHEEPWLLSEAKERVRLDLAMRKVQREAETYLKTPPEVMDEVMELSWSALREMREEEYSDKGGQIGTEVNHLFEKMLKADQAPNLTVQIPFPIVWPKGQSPWNAS